MAENSGRSDIVEALLTLEREKKTGALDFRAEGVLTRIFVDRGVPVFAEAGVLGETLGHVLVREQIITDKQFAAVVRKMTDAIVDNENVRFGEVVVELGILTKQDLTNALATQIEKKIIGCVPRGVGDWTFDPSRDVKDVAQHAAPIRALLVDAAKSLPESRVEALLKLDTETFPVTLQSTAKLADDYGLMDPEIVALGQFDGTRTTQSIVDTGAHVIEWHALLCALVMGGSVELLATKGAKAPPSATSPVTVSGRHRAVRIKRAPSEKVKVAVEQLSPARRVSLPPARNDREATLFSEDEFQSGKRLFAQGMVKEAHVQLVLAVERSPTVTLYRLYEEFVGSRVKGGFKDVASTKKLAVQMVKEDAECAFAYHVLGYIALQESDNESAKRFFKQAFRLDPELLDAGRQARLLEKKTGTAMSPATPYREIVPMRRAAAPSGPSSVRLYVLLAVFVFVTASTVGIIWSVLRNPGYDMAPPPAAT